MPADALLSGEIAVIGIAEAVHLCAVFGGISISVCAVLFGVLTVILAAAAFAVMFFGKRVGEESVNQAGSPHFFEGWPLPAVLFGVLVLVQAIYIQTSGEVYFHGDMMAETVGSFLKENGAYLVNPMTGMSYSGGIPLRLKLLCLPSLYSVLCKVFVLDPRTVVWNIVPLAVLWCCYSAFSCVGRCLFPTDRKKRCCFLLLVAVLLWVGSYRYGMDGFGLIYSGWRGVTLRNLILVPYLISLCLRRRWKLVFLCVLAEACIVWTFYGAGVCLLMSAGLFLGGFAERRLSDIWRKEEAK